MDENLWLPLDGTLIYRRLASREELPADTGTHLPSSKGWKAVSLGRKEGHTNIQISSEPGIELGTLCSGGRVLTNCANNTHLWRSRRYLLNYDVLLLKPGWSISFPWRAILEWRHLTTTTHRCMFYHFHYSQVCIHTGNYLQCCYKEHFYGSLLVPTCIHRHLNKMKKIFVHLRLLLSKYSLFSFPLLGNIIILTS